MLDDDAAVQDAVLEERRLREGFLVLRLAVRRDKVEHSGGRSAVFQGGQAAKRPVDHRAASRQAPVGAP